MFYNLLPLLGLLFVSPYVLRKSSSSNIFSSPKTTVITEEAMIRMIGVEKYFSDVLPSMSELIKEDINEISPITRCYKLKRDRELIISFLQKLSKFSEPELEDIRVKFYEILKEIDQPLEQAKKEV